MDWFHYMLLGLNALLLVLFIARSAPQHWVVPAASGAGEAASAEGAIAGGVSLRMSDWGESWEHWGKRLMLGKLRKALFLGYAGGGGSAEGAAESSGELAVSPWGRVSATGLSDFIAGDEDVTRRRHQQQASEHVCWTSSGDYTSPSPPGVTIHGRDCTSCRRGELCAFRVSVRAPAHWAEEVLQARKRSWWKRELTVTMRGPALGAGDVRCLDPPRCREMSVAYRLWDVGEYLATVHIGCANLRFSPYFFPHLNKTAQHDLVTWRLTVLHRTAPNSTHAELHSSSSSRSLASGATADYPAPQSDQISPEKPTASLPHLQATTPHLNPPEANPRLGSLLPANPCAGTSVPARWKLSNGTYHWTPYFCAHRELPPSRWIAALETRGIREISIVGDSHQRFFTAHLFYLLTGRADMGMQKWRDNLFYSARDGEGRELKINFYWIDGIYRNGEFGCSHRGTTTQRETQFPNISSTADVTLFEGGYWGASFCRQPLKALRVYLREFVRWGIAAVAPGEGRAVFRTIPSFVVKWNSCNGWYSGPRTNRAGMAVNALLKRIVVGGKGRGGAEEDTAGVEEGGSGGGKQGQEKGQEKGQVQVGLDDSLQRLPGEGSSGPPKIGESVRERVEKEGDADSSGPPTPLSSSPSETEETEATEATGEETAAAAADADAEADAETEDEAGAQQNDIPAGAATILDTWVIDAPRYTDTAIPGDHHYSNIVATEEGDAVVGEVGEAHVRAFIHYLLYILPPPDK
ncbi:hypothetical protein CLOM_g2989 [Closterium sp. NIES-68]|nr:hypothetical protein CLOM_g2989 [Closterium sp. NIES-68]